MMGISGLFPAGPRRVPATRLHQPRDEIARSGLGRPSRVGEADEIGEDVIPKHARHVRSAGGHR